MRTPEEIAQLEARVIRVTEKFPGQQTLADDLLDALRTEREARVKAEAAMRDWQRAHMTLEAQYREKQTFAHEQRIRAEKAEAEVARLREALTPALEFIERYSYRWNGQDEEHPAMLVERLRAALTQEPKP